MNASHLTLLRAPIGVPRRIESISGLGQVELEREGLFPGAVVVISARTPFGGPLLVSLGRTRLALSADVAASVLTAPLDAGTET